MTQIQAIERDVKRNLDLAKYHQKVGEYQTARIYVVKALAILDGVAICNYSLSEKGLNYFNEYFKEINLALPPLL